MTEKYHFTWSGPTPEAPAGVHIHGTPVADFMEHVRVCGLSLPTCHPALHGEELELPNSFSHFPLFEELHVLSARDAEQVVLPSPLVCGAAQCSDHHQLPSVAGPSVPVPVIDLLEAKLAPDEHVHLEPGQLQELRDLCFEFSDVFSTGGKLGCIPAEYGMEFHLKLKPGSVPVQQRPYSMSKFEEEWLKEELSKMLKLGVLTRIDKPEWLSPVVIAKHPVSGKLRLCLDLRKLNSCTELEPHPIPRVEEVVNSMTGCQIFSQIDISKGFWHIPVAEEDIPKLGFATPLGNLAFTRMPFGLVNAPSIWQKCMDTVFQGVEQSKTYIDDTFVYSNGWQEHLGTLRALFSRCRQYNISVNLEKCNFGVQSVKCLGYVVSSQGVHVDEDKVSAIMSLPAPESVKDVKSFLGMAGYFRHFVQDFASISAPLAHLTKKSVKFRWCSECQDAFDKLKLALTSAPCLRLPDWDSQFILHVDWSKKAIGAVLIQKDNCGDEYPVAFASRLLTPAEQHYICPS